MRSDSATGWADSLMRVTVEPVIPTPFYQLEEWRSARNAVRRNRTSIYSWKTSGRANWLERGYSCVDCLGLVELPRGLPDRVTMPDDGPA
jgi:hypothetical protein